MNIETELEKLAKKYNLKFLKQCFKNCFGGHWYVETYSIYNDNGCFTIHALLQRGEWDFYISDKISNDRKELTKKAINILEYEKDIWSKEQRILGIKNPFFFWGIRKTLSTLLKVLEYEITNKKEFFGIKINTNQVIKDKKIKRLISKKERKYYTYMLEIINALNIPLDYKWLISNVEAYPSDRELENRLNNTLIITNKDLLDILNKEDFQWIWGVFSLFQDSVKNDDILKEDIPDLENGKRDVYGEEPVIQHPLAILEIDAFDSSYVFMSSKEDKYINIFKELFPNSKGKF